MIIITGPGRSGTSFLAQLYKELGFDPGGEWVPEIHGGLEPADIVGVNDEIVEALGVTPMGAPGGALGKLRRGGKALIPGQFRRPLRGRLRKLPWMGRPQPSMLRWDEFDEIVKRFRPRLAKLAGVHMVTKDPRFLWTLPVWCAAEVPIEHVLISVRNLDATVKSRTRMDSIRFTTESGARNSIAYGLGLSISAVVEFSVPYSIVRFPDFLERPSELFRAARFPEPVSEDRFSRLVNQLKRAELIHDPR